MREFEWHVSQSMERGTDTLYVRLADDRLSHVIGAENGHLTVEHIPPGDAPVNKPLLSVRYGEFQGLMDALWKAGIRPNNGEGSTGQLGATERHLDDMRKIAFHKVGIK